MSRDEVIRALKANIDRVVRVTFLDGESQQVKIVNLDDEGFVNQIGDGFFWATFEDVLDLRPVENCEARPNFTGTWRVNFEKSTMPNVHPRPVQILMEIHHEEPRLDQNIFITYPDGKEQQLEFTYDTTGAEIVQPGGGRSRAHWNGLELMIESSINAKGRAMHFKDHWVLSADRKVLTISHLDDDLPG